MLKLIIEDDEGRKTVVPFVRDEITIGRQEGNTIRLTERNVSRHHARLVRQNGHVLVEDLGSYNGVLINGERIQGQTQLGDGDLLQIGDYGLALRQEASSQVGMPTLQVPASAVQEAMNEARGKSAAEAREEDEAPTPTAQRRISISTAVIRPAQVETNRPRQAATVDSEEAPHLVVVSAELAGQKFPCIRTEMRLGRTDDNDIVLDHRSLSRTHAKVVREDSGEWRIIDMQSANGLSINGESYAQAPLSHGDLIELGHVKLRFIGPGQSAEGLMHEGPAQGAKKGRALAIAAVALLGVGGGSAWFLSGQALPPPPRVEKQPPARPVQAKNPASTGTQPAAPAVPLSEKLRSARAAIDARDFDKAVATLESALDANGQRPTEAKELLKQARAELESKQNLDQAQKELDEGRLQEAQKDVEAAEGTLAFAQEQANLKEKVEAALAPPKTANSPSAARHPSSQQQARQLYDNGLALLRKQRFPEAESALEKCIALEPTYAPCYFALGKTVTRSNRPDEGAQYYREFLRLAPNHEMAPSVRKLVANYEKSQKQPGGGK